MEAMINGFYRVERLLSSGIGGYVMAALYNGKLDLSTPVEELDHHPES
jgi:hypothetical protein